MRKVTAFTVLIIELLTLTIINAQPEKNLTLKTATQAIYPQFFSFRGEGNRKAHANYDAWLNDIGNADGVIRKFISEEMEVNPNSAEWANQYVSDHPEKLLLLHLNGEAKNMMDNPEVCRKYFPGHWVYNPGTSLKCSVNEKTTELLVENVSPFMNRKYRGGNGEGQVFQKNLIPNYALLVRLDEHRQRLWYESEIIQITGIDEQSKKLTIERGLCDSKKLSYDPNKAYIAPIEGGIWGKGMMFFYNMSSDCPKDKNGKSASDVFLDEIITLFSKTGKLRNFNGIAFDVNYFDISERLPNADTNNDGIKDGGWVNNKNNWQKGDLEFLKNLRARMGSNFIITADGQHAANQQAVGVLNGVESEGLVQHNDGWRGFSRTVNLHQYWEHNNIQEPQFRYVVLKLMNKNDAPESERLKRFAIGTACCLKAYTTDPGKHISTPKTEPQTSEMNILPSWMQKSGALGSTKVELIHYAELSNDVLNKSLPELTKMITATDCNIRIVNNLLEISPKEDDTNSRDLNISLKGLNLPQGDITFFVEVQSIDPVDSSLLSEKIPRFIWANMTNLPDYGEGKNSNEMYNNLTGLFGTNRMEKISFYFRNPASNCDLNLRIQGRGKLVIQSIRIYNKADILVRKFEKGIVIVNPSLIPQDIDSELIGVKLKKITVPAVDAVFLKNAN